MKNPMSLEGNNIIVTGAGQGIGEASARLIAELGGTPILVDIKGKQVEVVASEIGGDVFVGSITNPGFVQGMVNNSAKKHGAGQHLSADGGTHIGY